MHLVTLKQLPQRGARETVIAALADDRLIFSGGQVQLPAGPSRLVDRAIYPVVLHMNDEGSLRAISPRTRGFAAVDSSGHLTFDELRHVDAALRLVLDL